MTLWSTVYNAVDKGRTLVPDKCRPKSYVYGIVLVAMTLDNLNVTGALNSSVSIAKQLHSDSTTVSWVLSAYALTLGSFIIMFGKIADIVGVHLVFLIGTFVMGILSLITAVTNNIIVIIVFRALQGIAGAALIPSGYAITGNYFQGASLENAIRAFAIVLTASFGFGLVLGGAFAETAIGYKGFFYFTFATSMACSILLYFFLIPIEKTQGHKDLKIKNLDYPGVIILVVGLLLVILGLTEAGEKWDTPKVYVTIPVGVVLIVVAFLWENAYIAPYKKKHGLKVVNVTEVEKEAFDDSEDKSQESDDSRPDWRASLDLLFPSMIFKLPNFYPLFFGLFCLYISFISIISTLSQYHQYVEGNSPILTGVKLLPHAGGLVFGSIVFRSKYVAKVGLKNTLYVSALLLIGTTVWISRVDYKSPNSYWKFEFVPLFIAGYSANLYFLVYLNGIMSHTPLHLHGLVTGVFQTIGQVGVCIASAITSTILGVVSFNESNPVKLENTYKKFNHALYVPVAVSVLQLLFMVLLKEPKKVEKTEEQLAESISDV